MQKSEKFLFQTLRTFVFELKVGSKPFSKKIPMTKFDLNRSERFVSLFQNMVTASSLKNLQKTEKYLFHTLRTFVFQLKVASKPFSKKLYMTKF